MRRCRYCGTPISWVEDSAGRWRAHGTDGERHTSSGGADRILARLHHPDVGGSDDEMRRLNGAYQALVAANR